MCAVHHPSMYPRSVNKTYTLPNCGCNSDERRRLFNYPTIVIWTVSLLTEDGLLTRE